MLGDFKLNGDVQQSTDDQHNLKASIAGKKPHAIGDFHLENSVNRFDGLELIENIQVGIGSNFDQILMPKSAQLSRAALSSSIDVVDGSQLYNTVVYPSNYSNIAFNGVNGSSNILKASNAHHNNKIKNSGKREATGFVQSIEDTLPWEKKRWNLSVTNVVSLDCIWAQVILPELNVSFMVSLTPPF